MEAPLATAMASVVPSDSFQNSQRSGEELLQKAIVNNEFVKGRHRLSQPVSALRTHQRHMEVGPKEERLIITDDPQFALDKLLKKRPM
jgi:hypothetical protein